MWTVMEYVHTLAFKYTVNLFILHSASLEHSFTFTFWMNITLSIIFFKTKTPK